VVAEKADVTRIKGNQSSVNRPCDGFFMGGFIPTCHAQPIGEMAKNGEQRWLSN
jgi:hypothetical protein